MEIFVGVLVLFHFAAVSVADVRTINDSNCMTEHCLVVYEVLFKFQDRLEKVEAENERQRKHIAELNRKHMIGDLEEEAVHKAEIREKRKANENHNKDLNYARVPRDYVRNAVAFFARKRHHSHHLGKDQTIIFEDVVTNIGNAYHSYIGSFIAPVDGVYIISTTIEAAGRNATHAAIVKNGETEAVMYVNGIEDKYDRGSHTIVLSLQNGDDVTVRHTEEDKSIAGDYQSTFSGILVYDQHNGVAIVGK